MKIIPLNLDSVLSFLHNLKLAYFRLLAFFIKQKKHKILQYEYEKRLYALFVQKTTFGLHMYL